MSWTKVPPAHVARLAHLLAMIPAAELRPMFGCPAYFLQSHLFAGAHQESIFLRLSLADQESLFSAVDTTHFTPMPGMVMSEYVVIPPDLFADDTAFLTWLQRAAAYVQSLPPKVKKTKKGRPGKPTDFGANPR